MRKFLLPAICLILLISTNAMAAGNQSVKSHQTKKARTGKQIYQQSCAACHSVGLANAPKPNTPGWKVKLNKGMPVLLKSIHNGLGAMPAGAMCDDCTDAEYKAAIIYMAGKYYKPPKK